MHEHHYFNGLMHCIVCHAIILDLCYVFQYAGYHTDEFIGTFLNATAAPCLIDENIRSMWNSEEEDLANVPALIASLLA